MTRGIMKKIILGLFICLISVSSMAQVTRTAQKFDAALWNKASQLYSKACVNGCGPQDWLGDKNSFLEKKERIKAMFEFRQDIVDTYGPQFWKSERIEAAFGEKFNLYDHLSQCIVDENNFKISKDASEFERAEFLLDFFDRSYACGRKLADTHMGYDYIDSQSGQFKTHMPSVTLGFRLRELESKYYVIYVDRRLIAHNKHLSIENGTYKDKKTASRWDVIDHGTEVTAINGVAIQEWVKRFYPYVSQITPEDMHDNATYALTNRAFRYTEGVDAVTFVKDDEEYHFMMPWYLKGIHRRDQISNETRKFFDEYYLEYEVKNDFDQDEGEYAFSYVEYEQVGFRDSILPARDNQEFVTTYVNKGNNPIYRFGIVSPDATTFEDLKITIDENIRPEYCFMQINSFNDSDYKIQKKSRSRDSESLDLVEKVKEDLIKCNARKYPLILDVKGNPGGLTPTYLHQYFMDLREIYPLGQTIRGMLTSQRNKMLYGAKTSDKPLIGEESSIWNSRTIYSNLINRNYPEGTFFTDFAVSMHQDLHEATFEKPVYDQPVYLLTSLNCVSACDQFAKTMVVTGRAMQLGQSTNGTGENSGQANETVKLDQMFYQGIPDSVFGVLDKEHVKRIEKLGIEKSNSMILPFEDFADVIQVNQPIKPLEENTYQWTLEDFNFENPWKDFYAFTLNKMYEDLASKSK